MTTLSPEQITSLLQSFRDQSTNLSTLARNLNVRPARENPPQIQLAKYDESVETFADYVERVEQLFIAQSIDEGSKVSVFVSMLQPKIYRLLKHLCIPVAVEKKSFKEIVALLTNHLCPKQLQIPARHAFINRKQGPTESINSYVAELRRLALPCNYTDAMLSEMLRDMFVSGLRSKEMLNRLFTEKDLTFDRAVEIAVSMELSAKNTSDIADWKNGFSGEKSAPSVNVQKVHTTRRKESKSSTVLSKNKKPEAVQCYKCAKPGHKSPECTATNLKCTFCKSEEHVVEVCRKKKKQDKYKEKKAVKALHAQEQSSESSVFSNSICKSVFVTVCVNGSQVSFEYDTGSGKTVITKNVAENLNLLNNLVATNVKFSDFGHHPVKCYGKIKVRAEYCDNVGEFDLYVVGNEYSCVVGLEWIKPLRIGSLPNNIDVGIRAVKCADLNPLLREFEEVFSPEIPQVKKVVKVHLKSDAHPVFQRARVVPLALQEGVNAEIDRLVQEGKWIKVDFSDWASPIVPVIKPNNQIRLCGDYSGTVNHQVHITQHPFPGIEEVFANVVGSEFITLDVRSAFHHMPVTPESSWILTLNTPKGLYRPTVLEFGFASAPAEWQKFMDEVFRGVPVAKVHDDIFISAKDRPELLQRLRLVLQICKDNGIRLNMQKCKFFQEQVKFLGYIVDKNGLRKTDEKVSAVLEAQQPTTVTDVKSFMGLVNFYRKFCPKLATIAHPLYDATKGKSANDKITWSSQCEEAFKQVKTLVASPTILTHYSPKLPLVLATDASPFGIGAVLSHKYGKQEKPIAFASRTLTQAEKNYSQLDREALAIKWGAEKFFYYLYGRHFTLVTDHQPLVHIFSKKKNLPVLSATRRLHYAIFLQMFDLDIIYRKSADHGNADFCSRFPKSIAEAVELFDGSANRINNLIAESLPITNRQIAVKTSRDAELLPLLENLRSGVNNEEYSLHGGVIMKGIRVVIPMKFRPEILNELHQGHFGVSKMKSLARMSVYWKNIDSDIENLVRSCVPCQSVRPEQVKSKTHFWEYPSSPFERIHVDFAGPFQEKLFLIIVDSYSKWVEVEIVPSTSSAVVISVLNKLFTTFGIPKVLVSDNGTAFTSSDFAKFIKNYDIRHKTCAPFHPASNGQAERFVFTFKQSLRALFKEDSKSSVQDRINKFLFSYRRIPNTTTNSSPAKLMIGRELRSKLDVIRPDLKHYVDRNRKEVEFLDRNYEVNEKVAVRNYSAPNNRWEVGTIVNKDGPLSYTVQVQDRLVRRHADQIRSTSQVSGENQIMSASPVIETPVMQPAEPKSVPAPIVNQSAPDPKTISSSDLSPKPTTTQPELRRSTRERKPPTRLNL